MRLPNSDYIEMETCSGQCRELVWNRIRLQAVQMT